MLSDATILLHFLQNFPGGGPPDPHLWDGGNPLPCPPPRSPSAIALPCLRQGQDSFSFFPQTPLTSLPIDHTHDPGLNFSRSMFEIASSQELEGPLTWNERGVSRSFMTMIVTFVWTWWGGRMYQIVAGVTSDVGVPSIHLVVLAKSDARNTYYTNTQLIWPFRGLCVVINISGCVCKISTGWTSCDRLSRAVWPKISHEYENPYIWDNHDKGRWVYFEEYIKQIQFHPTRISSK